MSIENREEVLKNILKQQEEYRNKFNEFLSEFNETLDKFNEIVELDEKEMLINNEKG